MWIVAEQGHHAGYVRNIDANPQVRVRLRGRWLTGEGQALDGDDPEQRLESFGRAGHARLVRAAGTALLTVKIHLNEA